MNKKVKKQKLNPTLWRTCRVLANRIRLKILGELFKRPDQTVGQVATRLGLAASVASVYLRALNARGLLRARRHGARVFYAIAANENIPDCPEMVAAVKKTFAFQSNPSGVIFRQATAFTHPRRIAIMLALRGGPLSYKDIRSVTGMSERAASRHIKKLVGRGFLRRSVQGQYLRVAPKDRFSQTLFRLACRR